MHCWLIVRPSYLCRGSYKFMHCERNKPQLQVSSYRNRIRTGRASRASWFPPFCCTYAPAQSLVSDPHALLHSPCSSLYHRLRAGTQDPGNRHRTGGPALSPERAYFDGGMDGPTGRYGVSYALDAKGKEILRLQTRRFAGHATVHFSYHANGSVALAEYSNAPDAGIQWYRARYRFDESGNQTGFEEQGRHDNYGPLPRPG